MSEVAPDLPPWSAGEIYRQLLEAMPVMLWTATPGGRWTHVNSAWIAYTGDTSGEGEFGFESALHPDDVPRTVARWREAVAAGEDYAIEYRLRAVDGGYRWFLIRGVCVRDRAGRDYAWVGTCTDIEHQKRAELAAVSAREAAIRALGLALETRDQESGGHTDRVTALSLRLGAALGLSPADLEALGVGARLHDVGKLSVPDAILLKPGPLSAEERAAMARHVAEGERFAAQLSFVPPAALALIAAHHERWDGAGYPRGLARHDIPLLARLFAVVDVYDALLSVRPYKQAWPREQALGEVRRLAGEHFDPEVVQAFLAVEAQGETDVGTSGREQAAPPRFLTEH